uniref:G protein-coupled receptor n=1 Tax=Bursaphelenchus xylophilus TaxID=6326 RepID=A0A1I7SBA7_BURXY
MEVLDVMYIFLILLECISLVFELTCIFFSVFIVFCSLRYKAFHVNLRIIMVAFYSVTGLVGASEFLATSMAAIDINFRETSNMLAYLDKPLYRTLMTSIFTGCTIQVVLLNCAIMERTCASVWLVDYERKTHLFAMTVTMLLVALFTAWIFDKIYNMTLSDRMLTYGIVVAAVVASGFLILLAATFRVTCLITLNILFIPSFLTLIYRIPRWKKAFMALYRYTLMCPQVWNKVDVKKEVRIVNTITGKKLNFAIHEERDIYFDQLQRSWSAGI